MHRIYLKDNSVNAHCKEGGETDCHEIVEQVTGLLHTDLGAHGEENVDYELNKEDNQEDPENDVFARLSFHILSR